MRNKKFHRGQRKISEVYIKNLRKIRENKKNLYLKHLYMCKKRMRWVKLEGLIGVLHEPFKIAPKESVESGRFFTELFQWEEQNVC